ncbi:MAG: hypothetical protein E7298_14280 [Lachnospiraceae bacterium]|nr:hypothetical protein [Lachnospiraceae bacterium]
MKKERFKRYQNRVQLQKLFGDEILKVLQGCNLSSRRMNKDFLQGVEINARLNGCNGIQAALVAAFARNHSNINTIRHYLKDAALTKEDAEFVLFCAFQRGVFGFTLYQMYALVDPEFKSLPLEVQSQIIKSTALSPIELQCQSRCIEAGFQIDKYFKDGNERAVNRMLGAMYFMAQNRGKAKDDGVYCVKRLKNEVCIHPESESCLACACPEAILTKYGLASLVNVINRFAQQNNKGNKKAGAMLTKVLIPRFLNIVRYLKKELDLDEQEWASISLFFEERING